MFSETYVPLQFSLPIEVEDFISSECDINITLEDVGSNLRWEWKAGKRPVITISIQDLCTPHLCTPQEYIVATCAHEFGHYMSYRILGMQKVFEMPRYEAELLAWREAFDVIKCLIPNGVTAGMLRLAAESLRGYSKDYRVCNNYPCKDSL